MLPYARPLSHWTGRELAEELVKQGIVESISPRQVGRLLEEADIILNTVTSCEF
jgi:putative transposase